MESIVGRKEDFSISLGKANLMSLLFAIPIVVIPVTIFIWIWGWSNLVTGIKLSQSGMVLLFILGIAGIIAHELIHAASWLLFGKLPRNSIHFGIKWSVLTPYAHCDQPMTAHAYRLGAFMPGLILGIIPLLVAILFGSVLMLLWGVIFTAAALGDFMIIWLLKRVPSFSMIEDHPSRAGCYVYIEE